MKRKIKGPFVPYYTIALRLQASSNYLIRPSSTFVLAKIQILFLQSNFYTNYGETTWDPQTLIYTCTLPIQNAFRIQL